jgi:membrane protein
MVSATVAAFGTWGEQLFPGWEAVLQVLNTGIAFAITGVMFAAIYRVLPSVRIPWRDVWIGAWITALLFTIGKFLIGLYIGKAAVTSSFGAAGSLVVLLVWVYYSAQIFLLGAEFTWVYAQTDASRALHRPDARPADDKTAALPSEKRPRRRSTDQITAPTGA